MVNGRSARGRLAQLVRALASHARGHWFESSTAHQRSEPATGTRAEVAEPADALRSGRSELTLVRVQISPSAPSSVVVVSFEVVRS